MTQATIDDVRRGEELPPCMYRRRDATTGMSLTDGIVIAGMCTAKGGTVYDRDCIDCTMRRVHNA